MVTLCKRTTGEGPRAWGSGTGSEWTRTPRGPLPAWVFLPVSGEVARALPSSWDHVRLRSAVTLEM